MRFYCYPKRVKVQQSFVPLQRNQNCTMRTTFFLLFFLLFTNISNGQKFYRAIKWQDVSQNNEQFLWFSNAQYPNAQTMEPYYYELIPIQNNGTEITVDIQNEIWIPITEQEKKCTKNFLRNCDRSFSYDLATQNKKNYAAISVPTIRATNGNNYEKLVSFELNIKSTKGEQNNGFKKIAKSTSVLSSGKWIKVNVSKNGIYKITYSELQNWGLTNLDNVSVWGNGGAQLPFMNSDSCYDDLNQIPIQLEKGSDGVFNAGDYVLFYAQGPETYTYDQTAEMWTTKQHQYSNTISYFITTEQSQNQISTATEPSGQATHTSQNYDAVVVFESNDTNLIMSGRQWYGEIFDIITIRNFNTHLNKPVAGSNLKIWVKAATKALHNTNFAIKLNSNQIGTLYMGSTSGGTYSNVVSINEEIINTTIPDDNIEIGLTYNKASISDIAWLDFIAVNARQQLEYDGDQLIFWDSETTGSGNITQYTLQNTNQQTQIWDITNFNNTHVVPTTGTGSKIFKQTSSTLHKYIAFSPDAAYSVNYVEEVANQNIHGIGQPNMVIVSHKDYLTHANQIADIHRSNDNLTVEVFTAEQVFNEFSSGNVDASAIRNLMRMLYQRAQNDSEQPKYLLLFGDGSYNNKSTSANNTNRIPTFQSESSINTTTSYVTDDFFGLLDSNEGEGIGLLDIGVGRIPACTVEQADVFINKFITYTSTNNIADWQNMLCFAGDDEDNNKHMRDANTLADHIRNNYPEYNVQKILFDAYPQVVLSTGHSYPNVTEAINSRMNNGSLIFNYTGHANERWMSNEKVIMLNDILAWQNINALPLFITATCEFSRYDDPNLISAGEHVLFSPNGGAVTLLSTTRVVYSSPNFTLNYNFVKLVFEKDSTTNNYYTLGDLVKKSKNNSGNGSNKLNFSLLGDPALKLRYPNYNIELQSINGKPVDQPIDTLKSLDLVTLTGHIVDAEGNTANIFNGSAIIALYDKATQITTLANDGGEPMTFNSQENVLFKGNATVENGEFNIEFIIPKDINFSYGYGKLSLFATNEEESAMGSFSNIIIGGINNNAELDNNGPEISLYLNDESFRNGGICDANPKLFIKLYDESGINTTGIGIGHDFVATLTDSDGSTSTINLNSYYQSDNDDYQRGSAIYQLSNLTTGPKTLNVKVWDIYNNSSQAQIKFTVTSGNEFIAKNLYCYPNPVVDGTSFYFEHNQANAQFDIEFQIYSITGRLLKHAKIINSCSNNYRYGPIIWDGKNQQGSLLSRGVYICRLVISTNNGQKTTLQQKLVICR